MPIPHTPPVNELRRFGLVTGAMIILFFGLLLPWLGHKDILHWFQIAGPVGAVLIAWAMLHPASLSVIHRPWMAIAEKIGWFNSRIILLVLFYVILTPIGFIMRLSGKDPLSRTLDRQEQSYRIRTEPRPKEQMERPF